MNPPTNYWEQLDSELIPRLITVGFHPVDFPAIPPPNTTGVNYTAFAAPYALLFCVRISSESSEQISFAANYACDAMRDALAKAGAKDWNLDGYVVVAIQSAPTSIETKQCLSTFEQSRSICRRHAIWPEPLSTDKSVLSWTARLDRVTVLALPEYETPVSPVEMAMPATKFLEDIYSRLASGASYKLVAEEAIRAARDREDFYAS